MSWTLQDKIDAACQEWGVDLETLAGALGVSVETMRGWSWGTLPREHTGALARFGVDKRHGKAWGERFQARRVAEGISKRALAASLGVKAGVITRFEKRKEYPADHPLAGQACRELGRPDLIERERPPTWGEQLRAERLAQGWKQVDLAAELGTDTNVLWRLEKAKEYPRRSQYAELVCLKLGREDLVDEPEEPPKDHWGKALKWHRDQKGWTLNLLCRKSGVSVRQITNLQGSEEFPGLHASTVAVCDALGCPELIEISGWGDHLRLHRFRAGYTLEKLEGATGLASSTIHYFETLDACPHEPTHRLVRVCEELDAGHLLG